MSRHSVTPRGVSQTIDDGNDDCDVLSAQNHSTIVIFDDEGEPSAKPYASGKT
ncbi:hypothetical protein OE88DRAFT_1665946 [Heliocybe sulcata]|uniref:Uncharacterized protein n=1 Tax=Heliocybe sulcata TaxID=5364 RepID=A0A5C3MRL1_9AGAM|nr:hypothetical protein OE88DRAFT_1665946 [Heliocybe sulcata]